MQLFIRRLGPLNPQLLAGRGDDQAQAPVVARALSPVAIALIPRPASKVFREMSNGSLLDLASQLMPARVGLSDFASEIRLGPGQEGFEESVRTVARNGYLQDVCPAQDLGDRGRFQKAAAIVGNDL